MNRRQFLHASAAGILATPALLRHASAQEGPFRVKYYPVAPGMGSRDTAPAPDGTIWFCGQRNGALGRLDPRDGSFKQVDLGKGAAPHGVIIGPDGAPWITEGGHDWPAPIHKGVGNALHNALVAGNCSAFVPWQITERSKSTHALMTMTSFKGKTRLVEETDCAGLKMRFS
jgi:hypothetical protein